MGIPSQIIINFLLALVLAVVMFATLLVTRVLDRRLDLGNSSKNAQLIARIPLLLVSVGAIIFIPTTVWRSDPALYSKIGIATFTISMVILCAGVVVYMIRSDKWSNR